MSIWGWIQRFRDGKAAARHAERIVARSLTPVCDASFPRAVTLPRAEARGYVRVKAFAHVARILEKQAASPESVPERLHKVVATLAAERLVVEAMRHLAHVSKAGSRRKAA